MKNPSKRITWKEISRQKFLMVCAAIFFVYGIVFYYVPLAGWVMAFQDYKPKDGLFGSKFVGLQKFKFLFSDDVFLRDIRNTQVEPKPLTNITVGTNSFTSLLPACSVAAFTLKT